LIITRPYSLNTRYKMMLLLFSRLDWDIRTAAEIFLWTTTDSTSTIWANTPWVAWKQKNKVCYFLNIHAIIITFYKLYLVLFLYQRLIFTKFYLYSIELVIKHFKFKLLRIFIIKGLWNYLIFRNLIMNYTKECLKRQNCNH
jgi:hypothetical protein